MAAPWTRVPASPSRFMSGPGSLNLQVRICDMHAKCLCPEQLRALARLAASSVSSCREVVEKCTPSILFEAAATLRRFRLCHSFVHSTHHSRSLIAIIQPFLPTQTKHFSRSPGHRSPPEGQS